MGWEHYISLQKSYVYLHDTKAFTVLPKTYKYCSSVMCRIGVLFGSRLNVLMEKFTALWTHLISTDSLWSPKAVWIPCSIQWSSSWSHFSTPTIFHLHLSPFISLIIYYFSPDVLHFRLSSLVQSYPHWFDSFWSIKLTSNCPQLKRQRIISFLAFLKSP